MVIIQGDTVLVEQEAIMMGSGSSPEDHSHWIMKTEKLQRTIDKLENIIKNKDKKIEELRKPKKIHNLTSVNIRNLTGIQVFFEN